jgi:hypothetical protein
MMNFGEKQILLLLIEKGEKKRTEEEGGRGDSGRTPW